MMLNLLQPNAFTAQIFETIRFKKKLAVAIIRRNVQYLETLLHDSAFQRYAHIILEDSVTVPGHGSGTPLTRATRLGFDDCVQLLLKHILALEQTLSTGTVNKAIQNAVYLSVGPYPSESCIEILLHKLPAENRSRVMEESLLQAMVNNNHQIVQLFLQCGLVSISETVSANIHLLQQTSPESVALLKEACVTFTKSEETYRNLEIALCAASTNGALNCVKTYLENNIRFPYINASYGLQTPNAVLASRHENNADILILILESASSKMKASWQQHDNEKELLREAIRTDDANSFAVLWQWITGDKKLEESRAMKEIDPEWLHDIIEISACNLESTNCLEYVLSNMGSSKQTVFYGYLVEAAGHHNYKQVRLLLQHVENDAHYALVYLPKIFASPVITEEPIVPHGSGLKCVIELFRYGERVRKFAEVFHAVLETQLRAGRAPFRAHLEVVLPNQRDQMALFLIINLLYLGTVHDRNKTIRKPLYELYCRLFINVGTLELFLKDVAGRIGWDFFYQPCSLMVCCRDVIRKFMTKPVKPSWFNHLDIPVGLRNYLDFRDLESIVREYEGLKWEC